MRNELTHFIGIPLIVIGVLFVASTKLFGPLLSVFVLAGSVAPGSAWTG